MKPPRRFILTLLVPLAFVGGARGEDIADLLTDAQRAYVRGDLAAAKEKFSLILKVDPGNRTAQAYHRRILADERTQAAGKPPGSATEEALRKIILDKVDHREASLADLLEFLRQKGNALGGGKVSINFVLQLDEAAKASKVTITLERVPFTEVLRYIGDLANVQFTYEAYAIVVKPKSASAAVEAPKQPNGIKIDGL
jgi:ATP/maltotriose-dependent transcriptional regulator MalT